MDLYTSEVRKYKKGKFYQWSIPLKKGHNFEDKEEVAIGKVEGINQFKEEKENRISTLEDELEELKKINNQLNMEVKETLKKLTVATDIIGKQKDIINFQDTTLAIYMNRGVLDRLRNKIPKELKTLEENKQKLAELEDSRPLVIELPKNE